MDACEVIEKAAEIVEKQWGQGAYYNENNETFCAVGALRQASGYVTYPEHREDVKNYIAYSDAYSLVEGMPETGGNLISYNDKSTTTKEDILNLFKSACVENE